MPTIEENQNAWGSDVSWISEGDEWSQQFGTTEAEWRFMINPRIGSLLPAGDVLEIAPGHGRWTEYLLPHSRHLTVVDLNKNCIEHCKKRFENYRNISYFQNDGMSLSMIEDNSIDFVFSFDSLVHVNTDVMVAYLVGIGRILRDGGKAFIHHSNCGSYPKLLAGRGLIDSIPIGRLREALNRLLPDTGWRGDTTATIIREQAARCGLSICSQEIINWNSSVLTDCISVFQKGQIPESRERGTLKNRKFIHTVRYIKSISKLYG